MDSSRQGQDGGRSRGNRKGTFDGLRRALLSQGRWPSEYVFKFIVPAEELNHLLALLDGLPHCTRKSRSGRYLSVTCEAEMASPDAVIEVYQRMSGVRGLVAL
ncbi:MAG: DUF493 family protein [Planctomycetota bacterium]